jgi:hypothetical protein
MFLIVIFIPFALTHRRIAKPMRFDESMRRDGASVIWIKLWEGDGPPPVRGGQPA